MSVVRRTIEAFPRGRTTEELLVLLGASFDDSKKRSIVSELQALATSGVVCLERNGRWKPVAVLNSAMNNLAGGSSTSLERPGEDLLFAVPATIGTERKPADAEADDDGAMVPIDPNALLRHWRSALRSDPR